MNQTGGSLTWILDVDDSKFSKGLNKASQDAKSTGEDVDKSFSSLSDGIVNSFKRAEGASKAFAIGVGAALASALGVGGLLVKSAADLQTTSKSFQVLTGNAEVANKLFSQLADYANNTPFEFPDIAKAGKTLLGFGINSDKVFGDVKQLGDIAGATGADFNSLAVVFGQVNATGRLMGQDALQLINNNIPITTILAKKLGTSVQEVKKQMEDGKISADLFNEALKETTQEGGFAFKGAEELAKTLNGRMSTLKDTALELGRNLIGVKVDPNLGLTIESGGVFDTVSKAVEGMIKTLNDIKPDILEKVQGFFGFIKDNGAVIAGILLGGLLPAFAGIAGAIALGAFHLLPFVAAGIALVAIGKFIIDSLGGWSTAQEILLDSLKVIGGILMEIFKPAIDELWKVIQEQLLPQLSEFWRLIGPILGPVLVTFAKILGATVVGAIIVGIKILTSLVQWVSDTLESFNNFVNFLKSIPDTIKSVFSTVYESITKPFVDAYNTVSRIAGQIKDSLDKISPFHRNSPSLIDNVRAGVGIIKQEYQSLVSLQIPEMSQLVPSVQAAPAMSSSSAPQASSVGRTGPLINIESMEVRDDSDIEDISRDLSFRIENSTGSTWTI